MKPMTSQEIAQLRSVQQQITAPVFTDPGELLSWSKEENGRVGVKVTPLDPSMKIPERALASAIKKYDRFLTKKFKNKTV